MRGLLTGWICVWLVGCNLGWAAPPDADLVELIRFYNNRVNEHGYSYLPRELGEWRQVEFVKEHHSLGRVATRQLPGTVPLFRFLRKPDNRHFYSFSPIEPRAQYENDQDNFKVFVWKSPGDGRIPVYVSTWIDRSDVFLDGELRNLEQFSLDSKRVLNVDRLRPASGPFFYLYPSGNTPSDQANSSSPELSSKTAPSPPSIGPTSIPTQAPELPAADRIQFEAMELKHPVTGMAISEDGRWLFIAHQQANLITVYDVVEQSVLTEIACPAPRSIVSRGSRLIVGNFGHGTVSVIDREHGWKIEKKIRLPKLKIQHLSAPQGAYFDGHVLVTCHGEDTNAASSDSHNIWLDLNGQAKPEISKASIAFVSADRRTVLLKDHYGYKVRFLSEVLQFGDKAADLYRGGESQDALVHQVAPGGYWFGMDMIMGGVPIQQLPLDAARIIIPDHSQPLLYAMDDSHLRARRLATTFPHVAEREVVWPAEFADKSRIFRHLDRLRSFQFTPPVAWTDGQDLYLFVLTAEREQLLRAIGAGLVAHQSAMTFKVLLNLAEVFKARGINGPTRINFGEPLVELPAFDQRIAKNIETIA